MAAQEAVQPFNWHYGELDDRNFQVRGSTLLVLLIIFSAALLLALLCLYLRWACRYRPWASATTLTPGAAPSRPSGLDAETINSFPTRLHKSVQPGDEAQCSICLGGLAEGEKVKVLPRCSHSFHPGCVDEWLRAHPSCPLCRAVLGGSSAAEVEGVV